MKYTHTQVIIPQGQSIPAILDKASADGWECITIIGPVNLVTSPLAGSPPLLGHVAILRRPAVDVPQPEASITMPFDGMEGGEMVQFVP